VTTVILTPGIPFTPDKCALCGSKNPPRPAALRIENGAGEQRHEICPRCDAALTKLARLIGPGAATFHVEADPESGYTQTQMDLDTAPDAGDIPQHHCDRCGVQLRSNEDIEHGRCEPCRRRRRRHKDDSTPPPTPEGTEPDPDENDDEPAWMRDPPLPALPAPQEDALNAVFRPVPQRDPLPIRRRRQGGPGHEDH